MRQKMVMIAVMWVGIAVGFLIVAHSISWAMEKETAPTPYTPVRFLHNRLLGTERVMDASTAVPGIKGNSAQSLQRLNAVLLQASHTDLKQPGIEKTPRAGRVAAPESQKIEHQMGRIQ